MSVMAAELWAGVDRLVDAAPGLDGLRAHRIELFAARRWRALGRRIPDELASAEREAALLTLTAPGVLAGVRGCSEGPLVLFKGPEIAAYYPDPALRPYGDVDLLAPDAPAVHRQLLAAGFVEEGDPRRYTGGPHDRPLRHPELPLLVEVHSRPNWPEWLPAPDVDELLAAAVPSTTGVPGILALRPAHHALVLAAHAWSHGPLSKVRDLVDVMAIRAAVGDEELRALAREWAFERCWDATVAAGEALLLGRGRVPLWARSLAAVRERTVAETHLAAISGSTATLPPRQAAQAVAWQVASDLTPAPGEGWRTKLRRTARSLRNAFAPKSEHDRAIDPEREGGARLPHRRRVL